MDIGRGFGRLLYQSPFLTGVTSECYNVSGFCTIMASCVISNGSDFGIAHQNFVSAAYTRWLASTTTFLVSVGGAEEGPASFPTHLLQQVLSSDCLEHVLLARLLNLSPQHEFVQHEVRLLKVEDDVQFADLKQRSTLLQPCTRGLRPLHRQDHWSDYYRSLNGTLHYNVLNWLLQKIINRQWKLLCNRKSN